MEYGKYYFVPAVSNAVIRLTSLGAMVVSAYVNLNMYNREYNTYLSLFKSFSMIFSLKYFCGISLLLYLIKLKVLTIFSLHSAMVYGYRMISYISILSKKQKISAKNTPFLIGSFTIS